ncbi:MAG: 16S rRNA processing protein RimM [Betaproteobacteria bacterium RIFCSPLOWO2_02_64_14]|nr:MAG: 16S rRNA processing protein RimM [Betaproteobacteria bacterium RIFCSPLOWO2_02_64_14]
MGRITAPYGVKGWVRVVPFTAATGNLLRYRSWWMGHGERWEERQVAQARVHGAAVVAQLLGCEDRDAATALRGKEVAVPRAALPAAKENEFYWADLFGLKVVNVVGEELGVVVRIFETGANDVLVVRGERERLIPFVAAVIQKVDLASGIIRVDWGADY